MEAQKDDGEFKMPDLCGTKGVSRTYFKSKLCREGGLFFANLYLLQDMLASSQNRSSESYIRTADYIRLCLEILWLFSTRCDGHFHIYPSTANELDFIPDIASITF